MNTPDTFERDAFELALNGNQVGWFADSHHRAREAFEAIQAGIQAIDPHLIRKTQRGNTSRAIETTTGGVITFWSTRCAGAGRGLILDAVFADNVPKHRLADILPCAGTGPFYHRTEVVR